MERFWNFYSCCCAIPGFKLLFVFFCSFIVCLCLSPSLGSIFSELAELRFHTEETLWKYLPHAHEAVLYNWSKAISVSDFGNPTGLWKDRCVIFQGFKHLFHGSVFLFSVFKHPYRVTNFMYLKDWGYYTNYWVPPDRKRKVHAEVISSKRLSQKLAGESKQKQTEPCFHFSRVHHNRVNKAAGQ